jgi:hypothetical protein
VFSKATVGIINAIKSLEHSSHFIVHFRKQQCNFITGVGCFRTRMRHFIGSSGHRVIDEIKLLVFGYGY